MDVFKLTSMLNKVCPDGCVVAVLPIDAISCTVQWHFRKEINPKGNWSYKLYLK